VRARFRCGQIALVIAGMAIGAARCGGNPGGPSARELSASSSDRVTCRTYPTATNVVATQSARR
jgi:hypothetical protein